MLKLKNECDYYQIQIRIQSEVFCIKTNCESNNNHPILLIQSKNLFQAYSFVFHAHISVEIVYILLNLLQFQYFSVILVKNHRRFQSKKVVSVFPLSCYSPRKEQMKKRTEILLESQDLELALWTILVCWYVSTLGLRWHHSQPKSSCLGYLTRSSFSLISYQSLPLPPQH